MVKLNSAKQGLLATTCNGTPELADIRPHYRMIKAKGAVIGADDCLVAERLSNGIQSLPEIPTLIRLALIGTQDGGQDSSLDRSSRQGQMSEQRT
ncbi:hypothetical protein [Mesorhizobium sp.]|uniref:hypothetical protein n=1 Tax=Mesorhizobium sp. TaxID=1871066 RepID=UPI000FEA2F07|nr:hypothetical protein [Mesorhizobium sp.]RWP61153.1 MAG: hypothetical protein EOR08_18830 [Mesorhizobium sp.]